MGFGAILHVLNLNHAPPHPLKIFPNGYQIFEILQAVD